MAERMARRRVKLYALNPERQWDDRGTGHVSSTYVERLNTMSLLVRAETDGTPLLESKIQTDTAYQKQQGKLTMWSEGDNFDLALSFQEKAGCDEIWEKICQVQGKDPSVDFTQEVVDESEEERFEEVNDSNLWVELPPCELGKLDQINEEYHSPLKQELLKGSGGVVAADTEENLDDDEEEGALFGANSPDPHRPTATTLLRETDKLSKECVGADTDGGVAGIVLDGVEGVEEEKEDKVAPHSPASGEYHSPLKQELLKGSGGVVAADTEENLDDDEEEGALFEANSPDPHRPTATPLLRETDKLSKVCVGADTDGGVAGVVLDGVEGVEEEEEDKVAPHSPASGGENLIAVPHQRNRVCLSLFQGQLFVDQLLLDAPEIVMADSITVIAPDEESGVVLSNPVVLKEIY